MEITKDNILSTLIRIDKSKYGIKSIGLFGSYARGEETEKSDIDIFVDFEEEVNVFRSFYDLKYDLEDVFNKNIDLISSDNFEYEYKVEEVKGYKDKVKKEIMESVIYV